MTLLFTSSRVKPCLQWYSSPHTLLSPSPYFLRITMTILPQLYFFLFWSPSHWLPHFYSYRVSLVLRLTIFKPNFPPSNVSMPLYTTFKISPLFDKKTSLADLNFIIHSLYIFIPRMKFFYSLNWFFYTHEKREQWQANILVSLFS